VLAAIPKSSGFTLIELMITITIFSLALSMGIPSYRTWIQNTQIRNAAESIGNGIQRARAEAVKRNTKVAFTLGAQSSWVVRVVNGGAVVDSRSSGEGSKNVTVTVIPLNATTITFSSLGTVAANADSSATLTRVDLTSSVSSPDLRNLRVAIGLAGNVRVCDSSLSSSSTDPRRCY